jgi:para-aminobenzoate synthetase component I
VLLRFAHSAAPVTGAPKVAAMKIIEALEPQRRSVYCGSIGYIGFDGNMDTNIAIRTLVQQGIACTRGQGVAWLPIRASRPSTRKA